ncbi:hypothetical protein BGZ76_009243 [Entomortierella beljakovae]|nr:hypothetical protein BGZ76_009243 [Entomortierella beljakovae]
MIAILGAALIFGLTRRRKKFNEKRMLKPMRNLDERVRARSMPLPPNSSDGKTGYSRGTNTKSESRGPMFGNFLGFSKTSGQHVAETNEKIDTMCISAELKDADIFSVNDASLISIGTGTDYSNNQFSVDELSANASPAVLPPQSSTDTKPNSLNSSNGFHYGGRGLSINIPQITTTHLESQSPSPSSDLSSAWSMFEDGESPQTTQHYPESLAPIPNEIRAPADSSIYDPSISESSSAFSRNSSHRFLSTPPLTSPNLSLGTTVSPVSPVSPISPRPSLSSGPSSRLSHRQSTQARKL